VDPAERTVVFVCLHGAAKSVIAAAYLRRLAGEMGLDAGATSAGIDPEPEVPPTVAEVLLRPVRSGPVRVRTSSQSPERPAARSTEDGCSDCSAWPMLQPSARGRDQ